MYSAMNIEENVASRLPLLVEDAGTTQDKGPFNINPKMKDSSDLEKRSSVSV